MDKRIGRTTVDIYASFPDITDFPRYESPDPELCVLVRLFGTGWHHENLVRVALWSMRSHMLNTDMRDRQPTVIFHVESDLYETARPIFERAGVAPENIIVFPSGIVPSELHSNILPNAAAPFLDAQLERFQRVIVLDADTFSLSGGDTGSINILDISLNELPRDELVILRTWVKWAPDNDEYQFWYDNLNLDTGGKEEWLELAARYCNTTVDTITGIMYPEHPRTTLRPLHNAAYINIPMPWLIRNPEFREFIREVSGVMGNEEIALAVWSMKQYIETGEMLPSAALQDYLFATQPPPFLLYWDLDAAWDGFTINKDASFVHLYEFHNILDYGRVWLEQIGGSPSEVDEFMSNMESRITEYLESGESAPSGTTRPIGESESEEGIEPFALIDDRKGRQVAIDVKAICEAVAVPNRAATPLDGKDGSYVVQHTNAELEALYQLAARMHDTEHLEGDILQCGLFCGGSAFVMAHAARDDDSHETPVIAIDSWTKRYLPLRDLFDAAYVEYRENLNEFRLEEDVTAVHSDTASYLAHFWTKPVRLAFIDSSHHYEATLRELQLLAPHIVPGGWLALHDYFAEATPGVRQAADEHFDGWDGHERWRCDELLIVRFPR